jgi:nitric oxide reductase activation protein
VPDPRVHQRLARNSRDLAVLLLLDLSQSTNDWVPSAQSTVLNLAKEASVLVAHAMDKLGDKFAIHGFDSNGRHDVEYYRFKEFDEPYGEDARARLAGMKGQLSTRMGAALRHAGHFLRNRRAAHKLILLLTDGEPHDIDVHDKQYLVLDTKRAVDDQRRHGIATFCMSLDRKADEYVARIFGNRNYLVLDQLRRLPEKLPAPLPAANHLVKGAGYAPKLRSRMRGAPKSFRIPPVPAARPFAPRRSTIRPVALFSLIAALLLDRARPLPSPNVLWICSVGMRIELLGI